MSFKAKAITNDHPIGEFVYDSQEERPFPPIEKGFDSGYGNNARPTGGGFGGDMDPNARPDESAFDGMQAGNDRPIDGWNDQEGNSAPSNNKGQAKKQAEPTTVC
jgi:hypothetical protein